MSRSKDDWINQRAYALWEAEGRPAGRSDITGNRPHPSISNSN
ncbi:DUF2934 domain-containing protein [Rhizobium cauense]